MSKISKYIDWIEYEDRHVIAVGTGSPWNRCVQLRVPKFIAKHFRGIVN